MTTISQLSQVSALSGADRLPVYANGDTRSASLLQVAAYVQANLEGEPDQTIYSITTSGSTFTAAIVLSVNGWGQFTLSAPATSGTFILPGADLRANGQEILITVTQAVASLAVSGNGANVLGAPTSLSANGYFRLKYDSISTTWYRIG